MNIIHGPRLGLAVACTVLLTAGTATAQDFKAGALTLKQPWTRATAGTVGAGFVEIVNGGKTADQLVSASSPASDRMEIHTMTMERGIMRMRPLPDGIVIPPGATASLRPGGNHLMLIGLKAPLAQGQTVPVTLTFRRAGPVKVQLTVEAAGATAPTPVKP